MAAAGGLALPAGSSAACPCASQGGVSATLGPAAAGPVYSPFPESAPAYDSVLHPNAQLQAHPEWSAMPQPLPPGAGLGAPATTAVPGPGVNRYAVTPPPGTLGQTYRQRSALIPDEKHPRFAAVEVHLPEEVDVSARGLKSVWTGEVWRLESNDPLMPGRPHIYAIKAEKRDAAGKVVSTDVRWVRLIMGRVVDLKFE